MQPIPEALCFRVSLSMCPSVRYRSLWYLVWPLIEKNICHRENLWSNEEITTKLGTSIDCNTKINWLHFGFKRWKVKGHAPFYLKIILLLSQLTNILRLYPNVMKTLFCRVFWFFKSLKHYQKTLHASNIFKIFWSL